MTYEIMLRDNEFENLGLKRVIIISSREQENNNPYLFLRNPTTAIKFLKKEKVSEVIIGGGSTLNGSMLEL